MNNGYFPLILSLSLFMLCLALPDEVGAHQKIEPQIDIHEFARDADFIFRGKVIRKTYRNSDIVPLRDRLGNQIIDPDTGAPQYTENSGLPYCFVTYRIDRVLKGSPPVDPTSGQVKDEVTLRFLGGHSQRDPCSFLYIPTYPLFDVGDCDLLFVQGNTVKECPLVKGARSRFRVLDRPGSDPCMIYNEFGFEILSVPRGGPNFEDIAVWGPARFEIPAVKTHHIGGGVFERHVFPTDPAVEFDLNAGDDPCDIDTPEQPTLPGPQFTRAEFETFVADTVTEVCGSIPPSLCGSEVPDADPCSPFVGPSLLDESPIDFGRDEQDEIEDPCRPWLAELTPEQLDAVLEQERREAELVAMTGGDPVLPETPCDFQLLEDGPLLGDITGPQGKPDCRVDLFDLEAISRSWLLCNDPDDPVCIAAEI